MKRRCSRLLLALISAVSVFLVAGLSAAKADQITLDDLVGCWLADGFPPVSVVTDESDPTSNQVIGLNALLLFNRIRGTDHLVFGSLFEWNEDRSAIKGPVFQNGAFDLASGTLTFGHPGGGLDTARLAQAGSLIYVHRRSGPKSSSMGVREMKRIECDDARRLSQALEEKKSSLSE
ncbi:MAG: hypothetical protein AAGC96_11825 [Pseudomonadota bacterium]